MSSLNTSALKRSAAKGLMDKLQKGIEEGSKKGGGNKEKDTRFWNAHIDDAGNGSAVIRFLPSKYEEDMPFTKVHKHAFEENGMWFIAECPSTIGKPCPVCEDNRALWKAGSEADKEVARSHGRSMKYIANVLIIKDPHNPENEGQIKLFRFGKKIMDKIEECFKVDPDLGEEVRDPFSFFDGMNFALRITTVSKFLNYDKSKFVPAPDLYDGDETKLLAVMEGLHNLREFTREELYKPYEELRARFIKVTTGQDVSDGKDEKFEQSSSGNQERYQTSSDKTEKAEKSEKAESAADVPFDVDTPPAASSDDSDLDFFRSLVND